MDRRSPAELRAVVSVDGDDCRLEAAMGEADRGAAGEREEGLIGEVGTCCSQMKRPIRPFSQNSRLSMKVLAVSIVSNREPILGD
jgi:hypothetical protein